MLEVSEYAVFCKMLLVVEGDDGRGGGGTGAVDLVRKGCWGAVGWSMASVCYFDVGRACVRVRVSSARRVVSFVMWSSVILWCLHSRLWPSFVRH